MNLIEYIKDFYVGDYVRIMSSDKIKQVFTIPGPGYFSMHDNLVAPAFNNRMFGYCETEFVITSMTECTNYLVIKGHGLDCTITTDMIEKVRH
jgi:hypothetical protein